MCYHQEKDAVKYLPTKWILTHEKVTLLSLQILCTRNHGLLLEICSGVPPQGQHSALIPKSDIQMILKMLAALSCLSTGQVLTDGSEE